jgi:DNA-binding NtrC family response regulator
LAEQNGWKPVTFSPEAVRELQLYPWPGNIRELRNAVERLLLFASGDTVDAAAVHAALPQVAASEQAAHLPSHTAGGLAERVEAYERDQVLAELKRHQFHVTNTAKALGLERSHLYKKCQQLGIDLSSEKRNSED